MRRVLHVLLLAVLADVVAVGGSRQPQPHVGEWEAQSYSKSKQPMGIGGFSFSEDGTLRVIQVSSSHQIVWLGKYRFDYSKNPITLDIEWNKGQTVVSPIHGIVQFAGEGKDRMQYLYSKKERPSSFQAEQTFLYLTKKVKE